MNRGMNARNEKDENSKNIHFRKQLEKMADKSTWLCKGNLKRVTESFLITIHNAIIADID